MTLSIYSRLSYGITFPIFKNIHALAREGVTDKRRRESGYPTHSYNTAAGPSMGMSASAPGPTVIRGPLPH